MKFIIQPIALEQANTISSWRYEFPFSIYDLSKEAVSLLLNPQNRYYAVLDQSKALIGYCCFGGEARVPGGIYRGQEPAILDIGVGMQPDRTSKGLGSKFTRAVLQFGRIVFSPIKFRVTVAAFNQRSLKVFDKLGFTEMCKFKRSQDGVEFVQLERAATSCDGEEFL